MRIREIAQARVRYGYRKIRVLLNREGWDVGKYLVYRLYTEEGLTLKRMKPAGKRKAARTRKDRIKPTAANETWSMDFVMDQLQDGTRFGCGLRRRELAELALERLQRREDRWAIVDLIGKGRHIRTVPVPNWVKATLDTWLEATGIESGPLFRCVCRAGKLWGEGISEKTVWHVVKKTAASMNIPRLAPHDLRRSCARFCHDAGGELEQIQFLLGHASVQTTERYIGCKQRLRVAVNDKLGIEPR